ncbi:MAG: LuxR C-terminal-related transcriptional regulator [Chloroflexota bacterium]|nr:LuxR C-terminal-related transcriptional regulator [Chloroflexota bacterium]
MTSPEPTRRRAASVGRSLPRPGAAPAPTRRPRLARRSPKSYPRPLTARKCATLERVGRDLTHKEIAAEFGISINTVGNLAANAYRKLGAHSAAAAVLAHRDAHPWCGSRIDFGPILERIKASRHGLENSG